MNIIIIRTGTCSYGANDYIEVLITIFTYFFVKMNCRSIFGWRQNSLFLRSAGSVLKMSLILSSLQEAHRQRTEKLPTHNSQLEAPRFSAHSILCFENVQRQIAALNTVRTFSFLSSPADLRTTETNFRWLNWRGGTSSSNSTENLNVELDSWENKGETARWDLLNAHNHVKILDLRGHSNF